MFDNKKHKFLFKCEDCEMITSFDFEDEKDIEDIQEDKLVLECACGGRAKTLRN